MLPVQSTNVSVVRFKPGQLDQPMLTQVTIQADDGQMLRNITQSFVFMALSIEGHSVIG